MRYVSVAALCTLSALTGSAHGQTSLQFLTTSGPTGALTVPGGSVLADGEIAFGLNSYREPSFAHLYRGESYQFGIGFFDFVELSGRLTNYPATPVGGLGIRDLSANLKMSVPKFVRGQPDIAIGINDLSGGAVNFRSTYLTASEDFGPFRATLGAGKGARYLSGVFGGIEVPLGRTGALFVLERGGKANHAGLRYVSPSSRWLLDGQIALSLQRTFKTTGSDGRAFNENSAGLQWVIPVGANTKKRRRVSSGLEPVWTPPPEPAPVVASTAAGPAGAQVSDASDTPAVPAASTLSAIRKELISAGLERVNLGWRGDELLVQFENTRYLTNEADAFGIVLGLASLLSDAKVRTVTAVGTKLGMPVTAISVDRERYQAFLRDGSTYEMRDHLNVYYGPSFKGVEWDGETSSRTYAQVRVQPSLLKFVGTEVGVLDYSLAVEAQVQVPLWRGAAAKVNHITTLHESDDVAHGIFGFAQQPNNVKSAVLSQAFWLMPRVLNVTSIGKFQYEERGVQNELTIFTPYRDDQVRFQYSRLERPTFSGKQTYSTGSVSYLFNYEPWRASVEAGYHVYRGQDKGPSIQLNRWIGDVQAQIFARRGAETRIGFGLAFPLTPRQGMRPGWVQLQGANQFPFRIETKYASNGRCNCITSGLLEEVPMASSARSEFLNLGRIGRDYFVAQLPRMREAQMIYAPLRK
jgi:hypothetical protein